MREPPLDAPDEEWVVWADAMQQAGDPRGELIALAGHPERRWAFVKEHADALLGRKLGRHVRKGHFTVTSWNRTQVHACELRVDDAALGPQLVVDLFASPVAHTMNALSLVGVASPHGAELDLTATVGWLRESKIPPTCTSLSLVDDRARAVDHLIGRDLYRPAANLVRFGPLAALWPAFAHLEHLALIVADPGDIQFGPIRLPALRSFALGSLSWTVGLGDFLANARWPELTSFELRLCESFMANEPDDSRAYRPIWKTERPRGIDWERNAVPINWPVELAALLESLAELRLARLALTSFQRTSAIFDALDEVDFPHLVELDLSDSGFDRQDAERLARMPLAQRLSRIVLARVRLPTARALAGLDAEIVHSCSPSAPTYRYIVARE